VLPAACTLLFPHQLHRSHPALNEKRTVCLVEESLFFSQYPFHKQKLVFHRASMKAYQEELEKKAFRVSYIEAHTPESDLRALLPALKIQGIREIHCITPTDQWLETRLQRSARENHLKIIWYPDPQFLTDLEDGHAYFDRRRSYFQTDFYTWQRKERGLLLEPNGRPVGGKWTFDSENRLRFPKGRSAPALKWPTQRPVTVEAIRYVETHFPSNPGSIASFLYPVTTADARRWLSDFLDHRLHDFGAYEDAMVRNEGVLHHSVLSPLLNTGLLSPRELIEGALEKATQNDIPLASTEGFIRQVLGWREFIRMVYVREGSRQRTQNYWGFRRKIPQTFWTGETGIHPVDTVIRKVLNTGYAHHIERLMVLGNFMLLCEFDPDEVYRWFMELFIDAYDWVMVPNVYGMTQFADGGLMTTKPYISGSNYLLKMGDWEKGPWQEIWDGLFWRFMHVHRDFFSQNPRLGMLLKTFDRMSADKREQHLTAADSWLRKLDACG
jgi:deoxyribodipyrimidine photolyase-related protein